MNEILKSFEFENVRERFYTEHETDNNGWGKTHARVFDKKKSTITPIYEYDRNYSSMLKTFEPFRMWDEKQQRWRNFALISPRYTSFEVLDLDTAEIIATKPAQETETWNFCPSEFHVPDIYDILSAKDLKELQKAIDNPNNQGEITFWEEWFNNFLNRRNFAFMSGCVWGDDWSYKLQAIDLTRISEGVVQNDDRFGYFVVQGELSNIYNKTYFDDEEYTRLELSTPVSFQFENNDSKTVKNADIYSDIAGLKKIGLYTVNEKTIND